MIAAHAIRRHHGGRVGHAAVADQPGRQAQAAAPGRPRQEPPAGQLRPASGLIPPERIFVCTGVRPRPAGAGRPARPAAGQHPRRAGRPGHGQRRRVHRGRAAQARPRRGLRRRHGRPRDRAGRRVPGRRAEAAFDAVADHPEELVTFGIVPTFGHTGLGYVHRGEPLPTTAQGGRRVQGAGVQGEAGQAHGRPVRRVRPVLLEQRHVRLAGRHGPGRAGRPPARQLRRPGRDRRRLGHAQQAKVVDAVYPG